MKNWRRSAVMLTLLAATWSGHEIYGQSTPQPTSSAQSSPNSGTDVSSPTVRKGPSSRQDDTIVDLENAAPQSPARALTHVRATDTVPACTAAIDELKATRRLVEVLERENGLLKERLDTEKRATSLLYELNESRRAENDALRNAVSAKNETILAKDAVIANQEKLITALQKRKSSPWKRLGDVLIGVAAGALFR